jgi:hypothetical protein
MGAMGRRQRRHRSWVAGAALTLALLAVAAPAQGAAAGWKVSGVIQGTYDNNVSWVNCPVAGNSANTSEHVDVDVVMRSRGTARLRAGVFTAPMTVQVGGGWTLTGSYPPYTQNSSGSQCGTTKQISCNGPLSGGGSGGQLLLNQRGRRLTGTIDQFVSVAESAALAPAQMPICSSTAAPDTISAPLFGLSVYDVVDQANQKVSVPLSKLRGRKKFSVSPAPVKNFPDCTDLYATCTQNAAIQLRLDFTPA